MPAKKQTKTKAKATKPKAKTITDYVSELTQMVELRTGSAFDIWLTPQLRATAMNMVILDKLQTDLDKASFLTYTTGSMKQPKREVNPLIDKYIQIQKTLMDQFQALGLNYNTAKGKIPTNTGGTSDSSMDIDDDPVLAALRSK